MSTREGLPRAKRSLGQNFLINPGVRDKIIRALDPAPGHWAVELGPGPGALTSPLSEVCDHLVAVELDRDLAADLPSRVSRPEVLEVLVVDGARLDYSPIASRAPGRLLVVGNLPFNAASAILRNGLDQADHIERLVLMFQREVALRINAAPGSKEYGLLSVVTQQRARVERLFDVSPGSFRPAPKVAAAVLRITPRRPARLRSCCLAVHDQLLRAAFAQRRKTLRNALKTGLPARWEYLPECMEQSDIKQNSRAEVVSVEQWATLSEHLCARLGKHEEQQ